MPSEVEPQKIGLSGAAALIAAGGATPSVVHAHAQTGKNIDDM